MRKVLLNLDILKEILAKEKICECEYEICTNGEIKKDAYFVLDKHQRGFTIYHKEQDDLKWLGDFAREDDACRFFISLIANDVGVREEIRLYKYLEADNYRYVPEREEIYEDDTNMAYSYESCMQDGFVIDLSIREDIATSIDEKFRQLWLRGQEKGRKIEKYTPIDIALCEALYTISEEDEYAFLNHMGTTMHEDDREELLKFINTSESTTYSDVILLSGILNQKRFGKLTFKRSGRYKKRLISLT
jgi:hypothetical protein